jgi:arsenate reductase
MKTVVFACVHNAGRSQMAAAFFNAMADPKHARAISAGTSPGDRVHPEVVEAMSELGFDLTKTRPALLTPAMTHYADMLVTMGCGEQCPVVPGVLRRDWPLRDPKGLPVDEVRAIRDDVRARVIALLAERGWQRSPAEHA